MNSRTTIALAGGLALVLTTAVSAETVKGSVGASDKLYFYDAGSSHSSRVTSMWKRRASEVDLFVYLLARPGFDPFDPPILVANGQSSTDRLETVEFGAFRGDSYGIVVSKFSGPKTQFTMNVSRAESEGVFKAAGGRRRMSLHYIGELNSLAEVDEYFARLEQKVEEQKALKKRVR